LNVNNIVRCAKFQVHFVFAAAIVCNYTSCKWSLARNNITANNFIRNCDGSESKTQCASRRWQSTRNTNYKPI